MSKLIFLYACNANELAGIRLLKLRHDIISAMNFLRSNNCQNNTETILTYYITKSLPMKKGPDDADSNSHNC